MELNTKEMQAASKVEQSIKEESFAELHEMQLALVGGGIGDVVGSQSN